MCGTFKVPQSCLSSVPMALRAIAALLCARLSSSLLLRGGTRRVALSMRDSSSVTWFKAGDRVRVTESVVARGEDLLGRTGTVTDTWTKCEEDPHCCCAELAEETAAVHVRFSSGDGASFEYYFAESELAREKTPAPASSASSAPAREKASSASSAPARESDRRPAAAAAVASAAIAAAASAAELEPLLAAEPRRDVAVALVAPLLAYKVAAVANGQKLMASLDATIALAAFAAVYYCLPT